MTARECRIEGHLQIAEFDRNDMEDSRKEALLDLEAGLSELKSGVEAIERKIEEFKALYGSVQQDDAEMIDLGNEDFLGDISVVAPETAPASSEEDMPDFSAEAEDESKAVAGAEAVTAGSVGPARNEAAGDGGESLFGETFEDAPAGTPAKAAEKKTRNLNEHNAAGSGKAVMDIKPDKPVWLSDMTGPEVKDIRSAISLNDRVMFITSLFRGDSMLFQDTVTKLNGMTSLDNAISYIGETFPEWNMNSDHVCRFMMAVRRKIRH